MKICVLGATGPSGAEVVKEALERGHEVRALVRNPDKIKDTNDNLKVIKVNIFAEDSMVEHMKGTDAVVSCLGCSPAWLSLSTITFYTDSAKTIVGAMRKADVKRFVFMTSWYTKEDESYGKFVNWVLKPIFLGPSTKNMGEMEIYMADECSDLDYTAVRPPQLTNDPSAGKPILTAEDFLVPGTNKKICRRDVAKFMLDAVQNGEWKQKCVAITSDNPPPE